MAWKVKKEWKGKSPANVNYPLDELTQRQILKISKTKKEKSKNRNRFLQ